MTEIQRRRRKVSSALDEIDPSSKNQQLVVLEEEEEELSSGQRFSSPEDVFSFWPEILAAAQDAYLNASRSVGTEKAKSVEYYNRMINELVQAHPEWRINQIEINDLITLLRAYKFGYGPIEDYMKIENVEEIYFNAHDQGFYIADGQKFKIDEEIFKNRQDLINFVSRIANENGLEINLQKPILDARLSDGSRLNAVVEPLAVSGADFIIRKHRDIPFSLDQFIDGEVITPELADDLKTWTTSDMNIIVSGGTASGKTTLLNVLGNSFIPRQDRVIILENSKELQIQTEDTEYLQTRVDPTDPHAEGNIYLSALVRASLRKRPDRIIVGEIRDSEAYEALKAWNSGHGGSFCTLHADSARAAISKLEQLVGEAGVLDNQGARMLISDAVDIVLQISRYKGTSKRKVNEVIQVFHPSKIASDPETSEYVRDLNERGAIKNYRDQLFYLTIYKLNPAGEIVFENNTIPLENR